jgi:hypothetical protein
MTDVYPVLCEILYEGGFPGPSNTHDGYYNIIVPSGDEQEFYTRGWPAYATRGDCLSPTPEVNEQCSCSEILAMVVVSAGISFASRLRRVTT